MSLFLRHFPALARPRPRVIGMIHLDPLPGSPLFDPANAAKSIDRIYEKAVEEARIYTQFGLDSVLVEFFSLRF